MAMERVEEALKAYRESVRIDPHNALARYGLGTALLARGEAEAASHELKDAIVDGLEVPLTFVKLGIALRMAGQLEESREAFQQAYDLLEEERSQGGDIRDTCYEEIITLLGLEQSRRAYELVDGLQGDELDAQAVAELSADLRRLAALGVSEADEVLRRLTLPPGELIH
ncbi:tetratricopeptide repeat protein [Chloracidobacterium sp. S]|nr:tetratricopeptide repeat protein [Chloracidobacterium aggregatum]QUV86946.1 tetratricopeptide repeat protein [Chloracidobacterium sp. S]